MAGTQPLKPKAEATPPPRWGTSAAAFYARLEDEIMTVYFTAAAHQPLVGRLVGVDQYDIFLDVAGETVLICKHAIAYLKPGDALASGA